MIYCELHSGNNVSSFKIKSFTTDECPELAENSIILYYLH